MKTLSLLILLTVWGCGYKEQTDWNNVMYTQTDNDITPSKMGNK